MLILKRLYSEENHFQPIQFDLGLNFISGDRSIDDQGNEISQKQNSVGKSLSIELINFCLLKKRDQSRVFSDIPDKFLPKEAFVNLHFSVNSQDYIISRNKINQIRIKKGDNSFKFYLFEEAKTELNNILNFSNNFLSARDYINFSIKEEDYSYKHFVKLYQSSFCDLLKIHFYFFDLPQEILKKIKDSFIKFDSAKENLRKVNEFLEDRDLDIDSLKAKQNQFDSEIKKMETELNYPNAVEAIEKNNKEINEMELELSKLLGQKKQLELDLLEMEDFSNIFEDDLYINDEDIKVVFNNYKSGLGAFIKKDLEDLRGFRDQVIQFKNNLITEKKSSIEDKIDLLNRQINIKQTQITETFKDVIDTSSNTLVKNFRIFKNKNKDLDEYIRAIKDFDGAEHNKKTAKETFTSLIAELDKSIETIRLEKETFRKTFNTIHEEIMLNAHCNFDFFTTNDFEKEKFFQFRIFIDGHGGKGSNQTRAVIYDLTLITNEYTKKRHHGLIIHDNLIFGLVDKDTSIKTLNFLNKLPKNTYQYIATVNSDDFDYAELNKKFDFPMGKKVKARLTKSKPLFYKPFRE